MKLLIWLIYPIAEALIQAYLQLKKGCSPNYLQLNIIRGIFAIVFGGAVMDIPYDMVMFAAFVCWVMGTFFVIFDPLLNELKNKPFGYTGKRSGWINEIIGERKWLYIVFYVFCIVLSVISFIVYNKI